MRCRVLVLWACLLSLRGGAVRAAEQEPLWDQAVATIALAGRSVASRIETRTEVYNGKGERMETHGKVQTLTGWNGQEPLRKTDATHDVVQRSGLTVAIELGARDNPFFASLEGRATHERAGEDTLDGRRCILFRFEETPAPAAAGRSEDGIGPLIGVAWLDRDTGDPLKIVYRPKEMPKHVSVYELAVEFSAQPDGSTVPRSLDLEMKAGFLWYQRVVRLHKGFYDWTMPPDSVSIEAAPGAEPEDAR